MNKVKVQIDLTKERVPHFFMGIGEYDYNMERWQAVQYQNIPDYYMYCRHQIKKRNEEYQKKRKEVEMKKMFRGEPVNEQNNMKGQSSQNNRQEGNYPKHTIQQQKEEHKIIKQEEQLHLQQAKNSKVIITNENNNVTH